MSPSCLALLVLLVQEPPSPVGPAFCAGDIDWEQTGEFPPNPKVKGFAASREDQILRAVGLVTPGASHGGWNPGPGEPGVCRLAFKKPVAIGAVVQGARYGKIPALEVAVLRPDAPFPGDVSDASHWTKIEPRRNLFVLPPGTSTRAVRIRGGVLATRFLAGRVRDILPEAAPFAGGGDPHALREGREWSVRAPADISPARPEWIIHAWEKPRAVRGILVSEPLAAKFDVSVFTGDPAADPAAAGEKDWKIVRAVDVQPPWRWTWDSLIAFEPAASTAAVRLRLLRPFTKENPDMEYVTGGKPRLVKVAGLSILEDLGTAPLEEAPAKAAAPPAHPPIPVRFTLEEAGLVTLVLEDADGRRLRNLVSETPFPAGASTAWWDGMDESRHVPVHIPNVAMYHRILGNLVTPGRYRVRGLVRKPVDVRYEFSIYCGDARPPWPTADRRGGWLADHTPPSDALFLPGEPPRMLLSSFVAEAGDGLVWTDLSGRRLSGLRGIGAGGGWWGADFLARDGKNVYLAGAWEDFLELWGMDPHRKLLTRKFPDKARAAVGGLAVRGGTLALSLTKMNQVLLVDAKGKELGIFPLDDPRGLEFDARGRLLALSGESLVRLAVEGGKAGAPETVAKGLDDPKDLALDEAGNIYASQWGKTHAVAVLSPEGKPLRTIGTPGPPRLGPYDPNRMGRPKGLAVSGDGRLWVAENSYVPKRVSVWAPDGTFVKALYGPNQYGGGGAIDPLDKTRFYAHGNGGGMEFRIDWEKGAAELASIYYCDGVLPDKPQWPVHLGGRAYFTNCFTVGPTNGESVASIWIRRDGAAVPAAAAGASDAWEPLKGADFKDRRRPAFTWSDRNDDARVQPDEVEFSDGPAGSVTVQPDLSVVTSTAVRFAPRGFSPGGAPLYGKGEKIVPGARCAGTSGGGQVIAARDGWTVLTWPPEPLPHGSLFTGARDGKIRWTYPCEFLGLHNSMASPVPQHPGHVIGATRLLGFTVTPKGTREELWAVNGNMGNLYLFTTDGLFVATLFRDCRTASAWPPEEKRGMIVNDLSLGQECFYPSINQTADGAIYVVGGQPFSGIFRVDGLETIRRLPGTELDVTAEDLKAASAWFDLREADRLSREGKPTLSAGIRPAPPVVDGKLDDWPAAHFVKIDGDASASVAVSGDRLYAAFRTGDGNLLANTGEVREHLFKTGGALDLMIGTDPGAAPDRPKPVVGDLRLLVTLHRGKPAAILYRAVVPGTKEPVTFRSWHAITLDRVDDVSGDLQFAGAGGNYEVSIPLTTLGLQPRAGLVVAGDVGLLRGNGVQTRQRVYWSNKATGVVSDLPTEALLTPSLWGRWRFVQQ